MSTFKDPKHLLSEWASDLEESPSIAREEGFEDAVDPNRSWNNTYARFSSEWEEYARGFDEGKDFLRKKSGKAAVREAFIELLNLDIMYTPENEHYDFEVENDVPFFTETYLYALVGKQDARTILAYLRNLIEACDFDRYKLEEEARRKGNNKETLIEK